MKLSKEEIKKLSLSSLMLVVLLYAYFALVLGPLKRSAASVQAGIAEVQPKIDAANKQIQRTRALEKQSGAVSEKVERIKSLIPEGSPIAWFPPRVVDIFKRFGTENTSVRQAGDGGLDAPKSFRSIQWLVDLPAIDYARLGVSVAELENREPLLRVKRLEIEPSTHGVEKQHVRLTVANIVRNEE